MNREVEERLVAMYFDNNDFEKHAKETIDTLGKLKDSMNLEDSVKGFDVFSKMKRNVGMEQMQRSANKLKETFSGIGTTLTKTFDIGAAPLRTFESSLNTMRGYISKYLGFDFAGKIVSSVEGAIRGLTIQPISQGWNQYENEVDSVRTIMSSTGRSIGDVTKNLDDLRSYADKTIYSLQDMTSNLGKFTNNGVELEDATQAMMGVANAAALAGQGTQQASMAMYNISQAIGVGKMTSIDWKSIENANMATKDLKNTFIQLAAAQNKLTSVKNDDGTFSYFYTKDSKGNEIKDRKKWEEVTFKNFRDTLSKGWLTSDVLTTGLKAYSGQAISIQEWEAMGITDKKLISDLEELGQKALEAAAQVRTFSKMMGTLKDAVASGWAQTFKFIFGDADEATTLWTDISDRIGGALNRSADKRNEVLYKWKQTKEVLGSEKVDTGSSIGIVERTIYGRNGREILIDGIKNLMDVFGSLGNAISKAFGNVFGTLTGEDLFSKTQAFEQLTIRIKEWLGSMDDSNSRLNKIFRIVRGILSAFKLWKNTIRNVADSFVKLLIPGADSVLDILASIGDFVYGLSNLKPEEILNKIGIKLKEVWEKIKGWFTPKALFDKFGNVTGTNIPILTWLGNLWSQLKQAGSNVLTDIGLGGVVDFLGRVKEGIVSAWNAITTWPEWTTIGQFFNDIGTWFSNTFNDTINFFTKPNEDGKTGFSEWIGQVFIKIQSVWNRAVDYVSDVFVEIGKFFGPVFDWISEKFGIAVDFFKKPNEDGKTGFSEWIGQVFIKIQSVWNRAVDYVSDVFVEIGKFFGPVFDWISEKFGIVVDFFKKPNEDGKTGFSEWIGQVFIKIQSVWNRAVDYVSDVFVEIGKFFGPVFDWISEKFGIVVDFFTKPNKNGETEFSEWISLVLDRIRVVWNTGIELARPVLQEIGKFLSNAWTWVIGLFGGGEEESSGGADSANGPTKNAESKIKALNDGMTPLKEATDKLLGTVEVIGNTNEEIDNAAGKVTGGQLNSVQTFFEKLFKPISDIINAIKDFYNEHGGDIVSSLTVFFDGLGRFITGIIDALGKVLGYIGDALKGKDVDWKDISGVFYNIKDLLLQLLYMEGINIGAGALKKWIGGGGIASDIRDIGLGILMIFGTIALLKTAGVEKEAMETYGGYMIAGLALITTIISAVRGLSSGLVYKKGWADVFTSLASELGKVASLYVIFSMLPDIIKAIVEAKKEAGGADFGVDLFMSLAGAVSAMALVGVAVAVVGRMSAGVSWGGAAKAFVVMLVGFAALLGVLYGLYKILPDPKELADFSATAKAVGEAVGGFLGGLFGNLFGATFRGLTGEMDEQQKEEMAIKKADAMTQNLIALSNAMSDERLDAISELVQRIQGLRIQDDYYSVGMFTGFDFEAFANGYVTFIGALLELLTTLHDNNGELGTYLENNGDMLDSFVDKTNQAFDIFDHVSEQTYNLFAEGKAIDFVNNFSLFTGTWSATRSLDGETSMLQHFIDAIKDLYTQLSDPELSSMAARWDTSFVDSFAKVAQFFDDLNTFFLSIQLLDLRWSDMDFRTSNGAFNDSNVSAYKRELNYFIEVAESMYKEMEKNDQLVHFNKEWGVSNFLKSVNEVLAVFSDDGIGSGSWLKNTEAFEAFAKDESAVRDWIAAVERIYEALQNSELANTEGITFNGVNIAKRLLESIGEGFQSTDLPAIDATPVTDSIIEAIGFGKTALAQAVHDMIQAGVDEASQHPDSYGGYSIPSTEDFNVSDFMGFFGEGGGMFNLIDTGAISTMMDNLQTQFDKLHIGDKMNELLSGIPNINDELKEKGFLQTSFVDSEGNGTDLIGYLNSEITKLQTSLDETGPITIQIQPVFSVSEFAKKEVQDTLNSLGFKLPVGMPSLTFDSTTLRADLGMDEIIAKLDSIKLAIDLYGGSNVTATSGLGSHMDGIRNEIAGMNMVLDTGVLVAQILPQVDRGLYDRALLEYRSGTAPRGSKPYFVIP